MNRNKVLIIAGVIASFPLALTVGGMIAVPFYMRFVFEGERKDFAPGDSFGVLACAAFFSFVLFGAAVLVWQRVWR